MNSNKLKYGIPLVIVVLVAIFQAPHFIRQQKQYRLTNEGSLEEFTIPASESAELYKQTTVEKLQDVLGEDDSEISVDTFARWSVLENFAAGYKLIYPAGFKADYDYGKVEITPPSNVGKVVVYIKGDVFEVKELTEGLDANERQLISAAAQLVRESFEFIADRGYDLDEAKRRRTEK